MRKLLSELDQRIELLDEVENQFVTSWNSLDESLEDFKRYLKTNKEIMDELQLLGDLRPIIEQKVLEHEKALADQEQQRAEAVKKAKEEFFVILKKLKATDDGTPEQARLLKTLSELERVVHDS